MSLDRSRLARPRARRLFDVLITAVLVVALAACSTNNNRGSAQNRPPGSTPLPPGATPRPTPAPQVQKPTFRAPPFTIDPNRGYVADMKTDKGDIIIELNAKAAPLTVNSFVFLARQHFYDDLTCHRVIPGFVAQCGEPKGDGTGGPGYTIPDENSPLKHDTGAIAMAKAGPNTAGSQFYITLAPHHELDGQYTVFGQVISGMDVAQKLTPRDPTANPPPTIPGDRIISITITEMAATPTPAIGGGSAAPQPAATTPTR